VGGCVDVEIQSSIESRDLVWNGAEDCEVLVEQTMEPHGFQNLPHRTQRDDSGPALGLDGSTGRESPKASLLGRLIQHGAQTDSVEQWQQLDPEGTPVCTIKRDLDGISKHAAHQLALRKD
jgi:hypothetical protein